MHLAARKLQSKFICYSTFIFCSAIILTISSCKDKKLFTLISSEHSGIHFNNQLTETDSINILDFENIYNGGGVGIGDFNNDGLQDVYFTGNMVSNKLYVNRGKLKFEDVTKEAAVDGNGTWGRGATIVDINNDGWQDIYVCTSIKKNPQQRQNLLYINQGLNKTGVPVFKEMATDYGLNDTTHSTMANFFDYDNDGDLDVYIVVNQIIHGDYPNRFRPRMLNGEHPSTGRLYRNDWNASLNHPVFTNVSKQAGITIEGYGHNASITDINKDGWKDILASNDYLSTDILYINNHDGTFTDKITSYFKHTSANAMGTDVNDINNDGLLDVIALDMNPEDNYRKKMMMNANSYQTYQNSDYFGYQYQYVRNTLQLNGGPRITQNDSVGDPVFSDISFFSGIAETDWSWAPLVTDFDNDGFRDIVITNGFPKDVTDHDFITFRNQSFSIASKEFTLAQIPEVKLHNYAFRNNGNLTFSNNTEAWGVGTPSFSNGAAYADLDNDGDMDMVVNNINDEASVYENSLDDGDEAVHYLSVKLVGDEQNRNSIGAWVEIYYGNKKQVYEQTPYRGYLSTVQLATHFGLDTVTKIDSLLVKWPGGKLAKLTNVAADQTIEVSIKNATAFYNWKMPDSASNTLLTDVTVARGINYVHEQKDFIDFNIQKLLPHKFSEYGPALAVGDVDGNGLDDMIVGGNATHPATLLLQGQNGTFSKAALPNFTKDNVPSQDMGITLFDADGDSDLDLYIARGGYESAGNTPAYQDELLVNNGKGNFTKNDAALPQNFVSKSCIRVADYDKDGDLDLFVAGRVEPWNYPKPVSSFIYRNDTKDAVVKFTDVTTSIAPTLNKTGLVCDALWTDFDSDGWPDLILAGEWMPVKFLKNQGGLFKDVTASSGIADKRGWWTSLLPGDFDNDGDIDYMAGNLGLNSFFRASDRYPVSIYGKDFDGNGSYDAIPTLYLPTSQKDTTRREFVAHTRDDMTKQLISFKAKFQTYKAYADATFSQMFSAEELKDALVLKANYMANSFIKNLGNGRFEMAALPTSTQYSCMNGMLAEDIDGDGNLDVLAIGNDYGTEVSVGRYDACNGVLLKGNGKGGFVPQSVLQSGWFIPGNAKALVKLRTKNGNTLVAATENKGPLKMYEIKRSGRAYSLQAGDISVLLNYKDGRKQRQETGYGASFLSQSGRFINVDSTVSFIEIKDYQGKIRKVNF